MDPGVPLGDLDNGVEDAIIEALLSLQITKIVVDDNDDEQWQPQPQPYPPEQEVDVEAIQEILSYTFTNRNFAIQALTHASYKLTTGRISYERLEFVGDSVLGCMVATELFSMYPHLPPGPLTRLRATNVNTERLARVAVSNGLHRFVRHRAPCLKSQIEGFIIDIEAYPVDSNGLIDPPKVLADIVESLLGAVFEDSGRSLEITWDVFMRLAGPLVTYEAMDVHPVTELYELCQKEKKIVEFLDTWEEDHMIKVFVDGELVGSAVYEPKKEIANNRAAKAALDHLKAVLAVDGAQVEEGESSSSSSSD